MVRDALGQTPQTSDLAGVLSECDGAAEAFDILEDLLMISVKLGKVYTIIGSPMNRLHINILGYYDLKYKMSNRGAQLAAESVGSFGGSAASKPRTALSYPHARKRQNPRLHL
jgi:hypothetical protein